MSLPARHDRDAGQGWSIDRLRALGPAPATVVDVGAATGTPALLAAFPHAYHVFIEPRREAAPALTRHLERVRGEYHLLAVGGREGARTLRVEPRWGERSSFFTRTPLTTSGDPLETRRVPVATLDAIERARRFKPPYLLKIDTEGAEREVLAGAASFLRRTRIVLAEISVARRFRRGYRFSELIADLAGHGFELVDLMEVARHASSGVVKYVDGAFRRGC